MTLTAPPDGIMPETDILRVKLETLRREHRDLDDAILALQERHRADALQLQRMKRHKLRLKDQIAALQDRVVPDIIA